LVPGLPVLAPVRRSAGARALVAFAATATLLFLLTGVLVVVATRGTPRHAAASTLAAAIPARAEAPASSSTPRTSTPLVAPATRTVAAAPRVTQPRAAGSSPRAPVHPRLAPRTIPSAGAPASPAAVPRPAPPPQTVRSGLDDLIARAAARAPAHRTAAPPPPPAPQGAAATGLPSRPSRNDVTAAMAAVAPAVRACAGAESGIAQVRIVFAATGRVTTAAVTLRPFAGTSAGSCIARAARQARVPPFASASPFSVAYPFAVR
jgi:hypothetical protein